MKVIFNIDTFIRQPGAVVTSGTFDGVHLGHQKILSQIRKAATAIDAPAVIITFWPHPRTIVQPEKETKLLSTLEEKIELIGKCNPDFLLVIPFTKAFAAISSEDFIKDILINKIGTKKLIIGYDHHFGKNREGSFEYLAANCHKYGFEVEEIPRKDIDDITVSSTNIRKALFASDILLANTLLGRPYSFTGKVVKGAQRGRELGFPTANIALDSSDKLMPGNGVYAVTLEVDGAHFNGMMNIGFRPTFAGKELSYEVHIFNFSKDIYGTSVKVQFLTFLRAEEKFPSLEALKSQLMSDKVAANTFFLEN